MSWKHRSSLGEGFTWRDSRTAGERVVLEVGPPLPSPPREASGASSPGGHLG